MNRNLLVREGHFEYAISPRDIVSAVEEMDGIINTARNYIQLPEDHELFLNFKDHSEVFTTDIAAMLIQDAEKLKGFPNISDRDKLEAFYTEFLESAEFHKKFDSLFSDTRSEIERRLLSGANYYSEEEARWLWTGVSDPNNLLRIIKPLVRTILITTWAKLNEIDLDLLKMTPDERLRAADEIQAHLESEGRGEDLIKLDKYK